MDVDGVLVDSPHERRAWREMLQLLMENNWRGIRPQTTYTPERSRLSGVRAALEHFDIPSAERKQWQVAELIEAGHFLAFLDALAEGRLERRFR